MTVPYRLSPSTLTFYVDGLPYSVDRTSPNWLYVVDEIGSSDPDTDLLIGYAIPFEETRKVVADALEHELLPFGTVGVSRNGVTFNGDYVHNTMTERMLEVLDLGLDILPWVRFMENLYRNPSEQSREELYDWMEQSGLPITSDGHFLAYKRVRGDYKDIYSGRILHEIGTVVSLPGGRLDVDDDRYRTCSHGLHFCSKQYLPSYRGGDNARILVVKINPADVVSIPIDYSHAKGRTWKYEIVGEIPEDDVTRGWDAPIVNDYDDDVEFVDYEDEDDSNPEWNEDDEFDADEYEALDELSITDLRRQAADINNDQPLDDRTKSYWIWKVASKDDLISFILAG